MTDDEYEYDATRCIACGRRLIPDTVREVEHRLTCQSLFTPNEQTRLLHDAIYHTTTSL